MGLFDKLKKKKAVTEEAVSDLVNSVSEEEVTGDEAVEAAEVAETTAAVEAEEVTPVQEDEDGERRFTILVEQAFQMEGDEGVLAVGELFGKMKQGDRIYVLFPNNRMVITTVEDMEVGPGRVAAEAENEKVAVRLADIKRKEQVPQYTVISNYAPNPDTKEGKELENPLLCGMAMEYPKRGQDPAYNNFLIYLLCHTRYVVPASFNPVPESEGAAQQVRFPTLPHMHDPNKQILPVFTDWKALSRWEGLFNEEHPEQSVVMDFREAVAVCKGNGFVINPFGPMTIMVSDENIKQIVNLDSFKKEFGLDKLQKEAASKASQPAQGPGMILGVPKADNPEVKAVTNAIVAYAKQDATIKRVDLLLRSDMQQKKTFVCIVDCPQDQTARIGEGILKATAYQRKEVQNIEFFLLGSAKFVDDMVSEESVIYRK